MSSDARFSYHRLQNFPSDLDEEEQRNDAIINEVWNWYKFKKQIGGRRRSKKVRIPGLKKFLRRRGRVIVARFKVSWSKAMKRLKDGRVHWNDLFGGNYMFLQVNPNPLDYGGEKGKKPPY